MLKSCESLAALTDYATDAVSFPLFIFVNTNPTMISAGTSSTILKFDDDIN